MTDLTRHWRPNPNIRAKSLAVIRRDDAILVCAIPDDTGTVKGWRPLGGTVEWGERAAETVVRELDEEIGAVAVVKDQLGVIENTFTHEGQTGHEIVFVFEVDLTQPGLAAKDAFIVEDEGTRFACRWIAAGLFRVGGAVLFPDGLTKLL